MRSLFELFSCDMLVRGGVFFGLPVGAKEIAFGRSRLRSWLLEAHSISLTPRDITPASVPDFSGGLS